MCKPSDEQLLRKVLKCRHRESFESLIFRYVGPLRAIIRGRANSIERADVDDILQDILLQAWVSLVRETPSNFRPWLYQLARNRCADWNRARTRIRRISEVLAPLRFVDRRGDRAPEISERVDEFVDVLRYIPRHERNALSDFYIQGFSIKEIADRQQTTPGTIKRRLSYGRNMVRNELNISNPARTDIMETKFEKIDDIPLTRPQITVSKVDSTPFPIDLQELVWWFVIPQLGDSVQWTIFEAVNKGKSFKLKSLHSMNANRNAEVHGRDCVEIDITEKEHSDRRGFLQPHVGDKNLRIWGNLTETEVQWIAYESEQSDGKRVLYTFLDEGWEQDFGVCNRNVPIGSYIRERPEGVISVTTELPRLFGDGMFSLSIGEGCGSIECMRVFELGSTESDVLIEGFVNRLGRTILVRRYNGERWGKAKGSKYFVGKADSWSEELPHSNALVVDGIRFVHYQDCLNTIVLADNA